MAENIFSDAECEVIFLSAINEMINSMANNSIVVLHCDENQEQWVRFRSDEHCQLFYIYLVDFLSQASQGITGKNLTYLEALCDIYDNPQFGAENVENLKNSTNDFCGWLNAEVKIKTWFPSMRQDLTVMLKRLEFIKIYGNISKHNFTRLSKSAKDLSNILKRSNPSITVHEAVLALEDFFERLNEDILIYHGGTIVEFLNNIRWGIYSYLKEEYTRSFKQEDGIRYTYNYPDNVRHDFAKHCYWKLMNEAVRRAPYLVQFRVTRYLKTQY